MAAQQRPGIPRVKVESATDGFVKQEAIDEDMSSPYMDDDDDGLDDGGDLDFTHAEQPLWLTQIPRILWETWSTLGLDDEIEIGTMRVEGPDENPSRISLKLNQLDSFRDHHKEYNLDPIPAQRQRSQRPGQTIVFSEQDLPGYKPRPFFWEHANEEGGPGQGRSQLHEKNRRDQKRKENNGKWEPYTRRPIPKKTALAGAVTRELEAVPVQNKEYWDIENKQQQARLAPPEKAMVRTFNDKDASWRKPPGHDSYMATAAQKLAQNRAAQERKQRQQENRSVPFDERQVTDMLFDAFREFRIWGFPALKARTHQPQEHLKKVLVKIAFKHETGDWAHKWELRDDYKLNADSLQAGTVAPNIADDSDMDKSGMDDDDDEGDEEFENAMPS